jgi:hypothetical protein
VTKPLPAGWVRQPAARGPGRASPVPATDLERCRQGGWPLYLYPRTEKSLEARRERSLARNGTAAGRCSGPSASQRRPLGQRSLIRSRIPACQSPSPSSTGYGAPLGDGALGGAAGALVQLESRQDRPHCTADQIQRVQSMRDCARTDPTGPLLLSAMVTGDDG